MEDEKILKFQIQRYQRKFFALALWLLGGDKNKAYDIAVQSFTDSLRGFSSKDPEEGFITRLASETIKRCRGIEVMPSFDESDFSDLPAGKRKSLSIVASALHLLPYETKAMLILRVQLHLPYKSIAGIYQIEEADARSQMGKAQMAFREKIEEVMVGGG